MIKETKTLKYMSKASSWKLTGHDGGVYAQHHYTGHTNLVVLFFRGATRSRDREQMREFNAQLALARSFQTQIVGIAPEPVEELAAVHRELGLSFPLLFDVGKRQAAEYGLLAGPPLAKHTRPTLLVEDKYNVIFLLAIAEKDEERPGWAEVEDVLKRFPRR